MKDLIRTKWAAVGAAVAVTLGAGGVSLTQAAISTGEKPVYVALSAPCRLVDTRPASTIGVKNTPIAAGDAEAYTIQVTGDSGSCTGALAVPADAAAVALNVTAIAPVATTTGRSFFTVFPSDAARPNTSNLNFLNGDPPVPNKVDVGLSADGKITIYNNEGTAHAAVDVFGYYIDHNHDDRYYTEAESDAKYLASSQDSQADVDGGDSDLDIGGAAVVVRSVTVETTTSGYVIANSSVRLFANGVVSGARCSITTGATVDANAEQVASAGVNLSNMISGTRGFTINNALPFGSNEITINLVCSGDGGDPRLRDAYLTAAFIPDPDAFGLIFIP